MELFATPDDAAPYTAYLIKAAGAPRVFADTVPPHGTHVLAVTTVHDGQELTPAGA